ncbi:MAG: hypothetical protein AAF432_06450, partial [Planctomycetota bacterium]
MVLTKRGRRRLMLLGALIAIATVSGVTFNVVKNAQKSRLLTEARQRGLAAYYDGRYAIALEGDALPYVVQFDKDDIEVTMAFADARAQLPLPGGGHIREAIHYNQHALRLLDQNSGHPERDALHRQTCERLLGLYASAGLTHEADTTADVLLADNPNAVEALSIKASVAMFDSEFQDAETYIDTLIELEPDVMSWREMALQVAQARGDSGRDLIEKCETWSEAYEGDARFTVLLATALMRDSRWDEARDLVPDMLRRGATSRDTLATALTVLDQLGMRDAAQELIDQTITRAPDSVWVRLTHAERMWQSNRIDEAWAALPDTDEGTKAERHEALRLRTLLLVARNQPLDATSILESMVQQAAEGEMSRADGTWAEAMLARFDLTPANFVAVRDAIDVAIAARPADPTLFFIRGESFALMGEHDRAMDSYGNALRNDPHWMAPAFAYIDQALQANRAHDAYAVARQLLQSAPRDQAEPFIMFARAHLALRRAGGEPQITEQMSGREVTLHDMLRPLVAQAPEHPDILPLYAEALLLERRERQFEALVVDIIEQDGVPAQTLLRVAELCRQYDRDLEQKSLLDRAIAAYPKDVNTIFAYARWHRTFGDPIEGRDIMESHIRALDEDDRMSIDVTQRRAAYLVAINDPSARSALHLLLNEQPRSVSVARLVLAAPTSWEDTELIDKAIVQLRGLLGDEDPTVRLAEARAIVRFKGDEEVELARALTIIAGVLEAQPDSLDALLLMADSSLRGSNPSPTRAIEHLERAVARYPARSDLTARLVSLLQGEGDFDRAAQYLNQLASVRGGNDRLRSMELALLQTQGDFDLAMDRADRLMDDNATVADRLAFASICVRAGETDRAESVYTDLQNEAPADPMVLRAVSDFYALTGRLERGATLLESLPGTDAERSAALGLYYQRHHRDDLAEPALRRALDAAPDQAEIRAAMAFAALRAGRYDEARDHALVGLKRDADNNALRTVIAMVGLGADVTQREQALRTLRDVLDPEEPLLEVLELLARVPFEGTRNVPTQDNLADAVALTERFPTYLPAWQLTVFLHSDAGRVDEAIAVARRAVARFPAMPEPCEWAARLLADRERWSEALVEAQEWRRRRVADLVSVDVFIAGLLLRLDRPLDARAQISRYETQMVAESQRRPLHVRTWVSALVASGEVSRAWSLVASAIDNDPSWLNQWLALSRDTPATTAQDVLERADVTLREMNEPHPTLVLSMATSWNALG